jgi:hypothetical protein
MKTVLQSWRMDLSAHTAPVESEIVEENWVVADSKIITETASRVDTWIRQRTQPYRLRNSQRKLSRCRLKIITETASTGDAWICQRNQPLLSLR